MSTTRDYYEVLGVAKDADENNIKKAFRRLARELHPDVNAHDPQAEEKFKEAAEAYEVLSDTERRQLYDSYGHEGLKSGGFTPNFGDFGSISDLFSAFFGSGGFETAFGGGRGGAGGAMQGSDVAVTVAIDLVDAAHGITQKIEFDVFERCETCEGQGGTGFSTCTRCDGSGQLQAVAQTHFGQLVRSTVCSACDGAGKIPSERCKECRGRGLVRATRTVEVDIPKGISHGQRIRLSGRGHAGERGGPNGDLYVVVQVNEDERFIRDGQDLITVVDVSAPVAALGVTVDVPTLDDPVPVQIPVGTQPGEEIKLGGRGMPPLTRGRTGDLRVVVNVVTPRRLSPQQRDLLEQLAETITEENTRDSDGMIAKLRRLWRGGA